MPYSWVIVHYILQSLPSLIETMKCLSGKDTKILFCYEQRDSASKIQLEEQFFKVQLVIILGVVNYIENSPTGCIVIGNVLVISNNRCEFPIAVILCQVGRMRRHQLDILATMQRDVLGCWESSGHLRSILGKSIL